MTQIRPDKEKFVLPADVRATLARAGCEVIEPNGMEQGATHRWNGALKPQPALVVRCDTTAKLSSALAIARKASLPVSIHNGGHDWAGRSLRDQSVVIDISAMKALTIDVERREATIGGGVTAEELNRAAGQHGLVAVVGNDGAVSMTGLMLGGGYGPLMTRFGLACDNLLSAEVVLPDGAVKNCDDQQDAALFWALKGGGGNFGVVTSARLRLHAPGEVLAGNIIFPWEDVKTALTKFTELMLRAPPELFGSAVLSVGPRGVPVIVVSLVWTGEREAGRTIAAELAAIGTPVLVKIEPIQASAILSLTDGKLVQGRGYEVATRWFRTLGPETIRTLIAAFRARSSPLSSVIIHHCHGAATQVAPNATAFGMREPHFTALIYATWEPATAEAAAHRYWADGLNFALAPTALPGGYANLLPDTATDQIRHAYGPNASRLAALKAQFDPEGVLKAIPLPPKA